MDEQMINISGTWNARLSGVPTAGVPGGTPATSVFLQARWLCGRGGGDDGDARLRGHGNTSRSGDKEEEQ